MNTVQRCSYKLVEPKEKLPTPWAEKVEYCKPEDAVECCTVYNYRYFFLKNPKLINYNNNRANLLTSVENFINFFFTFQTF